MLCLWKQRDRSRIAVKDMEISHVRNARNMMQRNLAKLQRLQEDDEWDEDEAKNIARCEFWIDRFNHELEERNEQDQ